MLDELDARFPEPRPGAGPLRSYRITLPVDGSNVAVWVSARSEPEARWYAEEDFRRMGVRLPKSAFLVELIPDPSLHS